MYWNFTTSREKGRFFTEPYTISLSQIGQRAIGCPGLDTPFGTVEKPNWPHRFFSAIKMILTICSPSPSPSPSQYHENIIVTTTTYFGSQEHQFSHLWLASHELQS